MDLPRFISLLDKSALYFARADRLGDPHEGSLPLKEVEAREADRTSTYGEHFPGWAEGLTSDEDLAMVHIRTSFVSCWNLHTQENAALWSVYGKGVAITSTYAALRDSLRTEDKVYIGCVTYLDYRTGRLAAPLPPAPDPSAIAPLVHKRVYFENEQELRAVISSGGWTTDDPNTPGGWKWNVEGDPRPGIVFPVELSQLVHGVHVAPEQPDWFQEVAQSVCDRFGLDRRVQRSSLDEPPQY